VLTPTAEEFARLTQQPGLHGIQRETRQYAAVMWNGRVAPLHDPNVRRALTMAMDRQQIIETLRAGYAQIAVGPIGPYHWAYDENLAPLPFNPDSARALLAGAALRDANGDGVLELPGGKPFTIELKFPANNPINRDIAEMIRSNFAAVGVRITTRPLDFAVLVQDLISPARNFEGVIMAWESDFRLNLRDIFHTAAQSGPYQIASYSNPRVDTLLDQAALLNDRDRAREVYGEVQQIMRLEQPWSFLFYYPDLILLRDRLEGVDMDIRGALLTIQHWWVTDARPMTSSRSDSAAHSPSRDSARSQ
jgi:peptide/nickel transport system substrate-binding protein